MSNENEDNAKQMYEATERLRIAQGVGKTLPYVPWEAAFEDIKAIYREVAKLIPLNEALQSIGKYDGTKATKGHARSSH